MKELSIEQKSVRYDEIIKKANKMHNENCEICKACLEELVPELAESEDERIKKRLIHLVNKSYEQGGYALHKDEVEEMIAWLEKQSKASKVEQAMREVEEKAEAFTEAHKGETSEEILAQMRGEQKPWSEKDEKIRKELLNHLKKASYGKTLVVNTLDYRRWADWLEKQGEQSNWKPSKDEMDALYGLAYITNKMDDKKDEAITKLYQDLKREFFNGATYENMFPSSPVDSEINIEKQGEQKPADYEKGHIQQNDFAPKSATEAANEEKVDNQNCIKSYAQEHIGDKVEPKFHVGDKIYLKPEYRMPDDDTPIANTVFEIRAIDDKHYKFDGSYIFIEDQDKYELAEQKPAENEELTEFDKAVGVSIGTWNPKTPEQIQSVKAESWLDMLCGYLKNNFSQYIPVVKEVISELKSLKDRVQSRQEWKQENTHDLTDFENVMMHIGDSFFGQYAGLDPNDTIAIKEQATILLGLVPKQEWSEEDEEMLIEIVKDLQVYKSREISRDAKDAYQNEIDWLKSLRPQNRWKPSDEQMEALDDAIAICSERDYETECRLDNLRQDLRKLREEQL